MHGFCMQALCGATAAGLDGWEDVDMQFAGTTASMFLRLLVLAASIIGLSTSVGAAPVVMVGELERVDVGDTFRVPILVSDAFQLKSFQFDLGYDESILELLAFTDAATTFEETAIAAGGSLLGITGFLFPGLLSGAADSMIGVVDGMSGSGSVAYVEFLALATGVSTLVLSNVYLDGIELGNDALSNGFIRVSEPRTLALTALALAMLFSIQIRNRRSAIAAAD
jgi:hypothetical protein